MPDHLLGAVTRSSMGRILRIAGLTLRILGGAGIVLVATRQAAAQKSAPTSVLNGVFTDVQAQHGESVFQSNCSSCHTPSSQTGSQFELRWSGRSVYDYVQLIRTTMPNEEPGRLSRPDYVAIVAFLFKSHGYPAAEDPLPDDDDRLKQITIEPKPEPASSPVSSKP